MYSSAFCLIAVLAMLTGCTGVVSSPGDDEYWNSSAAISDAAAGPNASATGPRASDGGVGSGDGQVAQSNPAASERICPKSRQPPYASGLRIREIALYQTVKIPLYENGAWVTNRVAPVVQGKRALVRVFVDTLPGYTQHAVRGSLNLYNGESISQLSDERSLTAKSSDALATSTFSFLVDGAQIGPDTALEVALDEPACDDSTGTAEDTRFPVTGTQDLAADEIGKLRVVVVPVEVNGLEPSTDETERENLRAALLAYYPVPDVELSVREPLVWPDAVEALDGSTWSDLLNEILLERRNDNPDSDVYYFGLVQPAATFGTYCRRGCILGLAPQTTNVAASQQIGLGASFADPQTYDTLVHELGHAHGRGHSWCVDGGGTIDGTDPDYPDRVNGTTASWGWDSRTNRLMDPSHKDIMGYCEPTWISAYNYAALAERSLSVNNSQALLRGADTGTPWQHVILYGDGRARWGGSNESTMPVGGQVELADVLDLAGHAIAQVEVVRIALSHASDQFLYLPEPAADWAALALSDRVLELGNIQPPRVR